jgi:hypothetical protein
MALPETGSPLGSAAIAVVVPAWRRQQRRPRRRRLQLPPPHRWLRILLRQFLSASPSRSSNQSSSGKNLSTLGSTYQMVSSIFGGVAFSRAWSEAVYHLREGARQGGPDVSSWPHTINSNRMVRFSSVVAASPCRNEPLNDHECYCLNAWAWGSEADLKPAAIRSFLPQFPTGQDLHSKQE